MIDAIASAEIAIRMVREAKVLVFDTETSGTDWKRHNPIGYVCCDATEAVYVPIRHGGGGNLPDPMTRPIGSPFDSLIQHSFEVELARAFEHRASLGSMLTVGHQIKFDAHMAANAEIRIGRNLSCTMNNEALLDEYARSYSLEACAIRHGVEAKKGESLYQHISDLYGCPADRKAMAHFWELSGSDPIAVDYACGDGITTSELYLAQQKKIEEQELSQVNRLEDRLIWTLFRMERRGVRMDTDYLAQLMTLVEDRIRMARERLPTGFNERSSKQVKAYIESTGHKDWPTTDLGNPSFTEKWLKYFDEGRDIVTVRKWTNLKNSFVTPLMTEHIYNGRVHATINQLKADEYGTPSRLSYSRPNLQQIPKRDLDLALVFRRAFIADEGMEFNEGDWSQCEPRLFAHYSKEPRLVEGYNKQPPDDVHEMVAALLLVERDPTAKRMNMGLFTGLYPKSFAVHMEWPLDKATEKWNQWHAMFPAIQVFQDQAAEVLRRRGYVKTILGRRLRLENPRFAYRAVSKIIQGGNADIMKTKMLETDEMYESAGDTDANLLVSVHDSQAWQSSKTKAGQELATETLRIMADVQGSPFNLRVPFVVDHKKGPNWAIATFGDNVEGNR